MSKNGWRFVVRELPESDPENYIRIAKVGRRRLGKMVGAKQVIETDKARLTFEVHQGKRADSGKMVIRLAASQTAILGIRNGDVITLGGSAKQKAKLTGTEICVITLDCSLSMQGSKFENALKATRAFLDEKNRMKEGDVVGCVGFAGTPSTIFLPTTKYSAASKALGTPVLNWGTDIGLALDHARELITGAAGSKLSRKKDKKRFQTDLRHIILIADGNGNPHSPPPAARKCKKEGIVVDVIGLVDGTVQEDLLKEIAKITGGRYRSFDATDWNALARLTQTFKDASKDKLLQ